MLLRTLNVLDIDELMARYWPVLLIAGGAIQNFHLNDQVVTTLSGAHQTITGGPVASQEVIKELGTNGGGFYNANSAHPFENPNPFTNWFEIFLLLLIPFATPRAFGKMVGDNRQGYALVAVMAIIWIVAVGGISFFEMQGAGAATHLAHGAAEGTETRFGTPGCSLFAASLHSITSSARASSVAGTSRPSAFAVLRLTTRSYLVGACTGRSEGFSPLRMRST